MNEDTQTQPAPQDGWQELQRGLGSNLVLFAIVLGVSYAIGAVIGAYALAPLVAALGVVIVLRRRHAHGTLAEVRLGWTAYALGAAAGVIGFTALQDWSPTTAKVAIIAAFIVAFAWNAPGLLWSELPSARKRNLLLALTLVTIVLIGVVAMSCGGDSKPATTPTAVATSFLSATKPLAIKTRGGATAQLKVEVAQTKEEISRGLSNRTSLEPDAGMLFLIVTRGAGFWMKDTSIPLSVAFVTKCGDIVEMQDMQPLTDRLHQSPITYAFGLEVNQGWFTKQGVAVGDKVALPPELTQAGC